MADGKLEDSSHRGDSLRVEGDGDGVEAFMDVVCSIVYKGHLQKNQDDDFALC